MPVIAPQYVLSVGWNEKDTANFDRRRNVRKVLQQLYIESQFFSVYIDTVLILKL